MHKPKTKKQTQVEATEQGTLPGAMMEKIGARMRDLRLEKGLSLAMMRQRGGLPQSHASTAERGLVSVTLGTLVQVAEALDVPLFLCSRSPRTTRSRRCSRRFGRPGAAIFGPRRLRFAESSVCRT
jgi:transcriptional regulator with XRE-family HTH domain